MWYRVSKGLVCLYILEKVEIWWGVTDPSQTTECSATQLVSSIKFKLSHAIQATYTSADTMNASIPQLLNMANRVKGSLHKYIS